MTPLITQPTAAIARVIEDLVIAQRDSKYFVVKGACALSSRVVSVTVFPIFLLLELTFKRIPMMVGSIGNRVQFNRQSDKAVKFALSFLATPLGLRAPEGISGFFLKTPPSSSVRPFGVERLFGKPVDAIEYPRTIAEVQELVKRARREKAQVSIIGAGMSQGTQTVPQQTKHSVINTKYLNRIELSRSGKTVKAGAGATWEMIQLTLNKHGKSSIVKQASNPFSLGGSIGINCHGWEHEVGAIASTVKSLTIVNARGKVKKLRPGDELFGCMFGTLGYFGVVVDVELNVTDNREMVEKAEEVSLDRYASYYHSKIKGKAPLFLGRLTLDSLKGSPLRSVYMCRYEHTAPKGSQRLEGRIAPEPEFGTRFERIGLQLISHLSNFSFKLLISWFWNKECSAMLQRKVMTRNEVLHPPINSFNMLRHSNLHTQWLQEYFIKEKNLPSFLRFLGAELKANQVRLINASIRPTPRDRISILPYAERDRHAVVICFAQTKSNDKIEKTRKWMEKVNRWVISHKDRFYQAYMPFATRKQFETCYGRASVKQMRALKQKYDHKHVFGNAHTHKYFDAR